MKRLKDQGQILFPELEMKQKKRKKKKKKENETVWTQTTFPNQIVELASFFNATF